MSHSTASLSHTHKLMNRLLQYFLPTKRQDQQDSGIHSHNHNVKANTIYSLVILVTSTTKLIDKEIEYNMWNKLKKYGMQHDSSSFLQLFVKTTTSAYFFHGFIEGKKRKKPSLLIDLLHLWCCFMPNKKLPPITCIILFKANGYNFPHIHLLLSRLHQIYIKITFCFYPNTYVTLAKVH